MITFPRRAPSFQMIDLFTRRFRRYSPMFSRNFVLIAFAFSYHRHILMDNVILLSFIQSFSVDLVITRYPKILSIVPRILCAYCLTVPCRMNTPTDNSSPLSRICSFLVIHVFRKNILKCYSTFRESFATYCFGKSCVPALWLIPYF